MLFSRRIPADWREKLRISLWPRRSWFRSGKYVGKRVLRLTGSPHAVAAGVAAGVYASFTPFMGLHFLLAFVLAYILAGNLLAAALGTFIGNPLSFPFIWASTYTTGNLILARSSEVEGGGPGNTMSNLAESGMWDNGFASLFDKLAGVWNPILKPMLVGSVPVGIPIAICFYILTRWLAIKFRDARRIKLEKKAAELKSENATDNNTFSA